jgi:hypothetical protein
MEKEDTISVQWVHEDVEMLHSLLNNNNELHIVNVFMYKYVFNVLNVMNMYLNV